MPTIDDRHPASASPGERRLATAGDRQPGGAGRRSHRAGAGTLPGLRDDEAPVERRVSRAGAALLAAVLTGGLAALNAAHAGAQAPPPTEEADGLVHVSLVLEGQEIDVAFPPDLAADGPAYAELLAGTAVRVGTFEAHRALRMGTLAPDLEALAAERAEAAARTAAPAQAAAAASPVFTASLHATAAEAGRLVLRWGRQAWQSDFRFDELPPPPRRPRVSGRGTPRQAADDNSPTARNNMLNERNETALVLPDGTRISMLYWKGIDVDDEDYPRVADTPDGAVVGMIRAPVLRLKSDVSLRFGEADVPTGNLAPGFAGAYGVWLRRTGDGWQFVFNHEPDSWGTQHDPDFDAAATAVDYSRSAGSFRPLGATLVPTGPDEGRLVVHWGPHKWSADFIVVREAAE